MRKIYVPQLEKDIVFSSGKVPDIVLVCGPCRSGTTAFANNFTVAGMESHMQPMKSVLRERARGINTLGQEIVFFTPEVLLIKETFGAESTVELFDPVAILLDAGYPASKIKVVGMIREPVAAYDSWIRLWGSQINIAVFEGAYRLMNSLHDRCVREQVTFLPYVPEIIARNDARDVMKGVASHLDLPYAATGAVTWKNTPKFGDRDETLAHLHFYDKPPERFIAGVREWGGYVFRNTVERCDHIVPGVSCAVYARYREACERALNMTV